MSFGKSTKKTVLIEVDQPLVFKTVSSLSALIYNVTASIHLINFRWIL